jgi:phosphatidylcholine synthase
MVHLLTASGAVFAMLALLAAVQENWPVMFLWLVVAFVVDGIDGPLARKVDVKTHAPRFDGALLDLIIDYLTYVFIPAFALFQAGLLPGLAGWAALFAITGASAMYFAIDSMKTDDASFLGFPGCWNMVVLVFFALTPPVWLMAITVAALCVAMFLPLKFIHPVRTARWRPVSLPVALIWTVCAGWAAWTGFAAQGSTVWAWGLGLSSAYLALAGMAHQLRSRGHDA